LPARVIVHRAFLFSGRLIVFLKGGDRSESKKNEKENSQKGRKKDSQISKENRKKSSEKGKKSSTKSEEENDKEEKKVIT